MKWILVIQEDKDLANIVSKTLTDKLDNTTVCVSNFADARRKMLDHGRLNCRAVVSSVSAASSASEPRPIGGNRVGAAAFIGDIRDEQAHPPFVFLVRFDDGSAGDALAELGDIKLLSVSAVNELPGVVQQFGCGTAHGTAQLTHEVDAEITLSRHGCHWELRGTHARPLENTGTIHVTQTELKALLDDCRFDVQADMRTIRQTGRRLYELMMGNNMRSELALRLSGHLHDMTAVRFRFHLDHETNGLLVETLGRPLDGETNELQYWMLNAPIVRKYGGYGARLPLFKDRRSRSMPIECLIILGECRSFSAAAPVASDFNVPIPKACEEAETLYRYFDEHRDDFGIGNVTLLRPGKKHKEGFGAVVRRTLGERPWQLIHYAGHSAIAGNGRGYLVLGGDADDQIDIDTFARAASHLQFLFLSSCSSGSAEFVSRLAEKNIPAVAGYAWPIDDLLALDFAVLFYEDLFAGRVSQRFLEYSFMRGKARMYEAYKDTSAWAAPLLFMQINNAQPDQA